MKKRFFKEVIVWFEKSDKELIRYRLFQDLSNDKFFVKNADDFHDEFNLKTTQQQDAYFVDSLFLSGITHFAKKSFHTIEEAIDNFEAGFE
jgi:hypothetical protein